MKPRQLPAAGPGLLSISHRLRLRDYTTANLVEEHTALTTDQLAVMLFGHRNTCRKRLGVLRRIGFIDRFIRPRPGIRSEVCWVPGPLSTRYVALAREEKPPTVQALRDRQDRAYTSPYLEHLLQVNQFFVDLLARARHQPGADLLRWWSERSTAAAFDQRIHPDGHGVWRDETGEIGFFLELDRGTESLTRLVDKLTAYEQFRFGGGPDYPVLFALHSRLREDHLHAKLADHAAFELTVATCVRQAGVSPSGALWWPAGGERRRLRLTQLPSDHGSPNRSRPGPAAASEHPLSLLTGVPLLP